MRDNVSEWDNGTLGKLSTLSSELEKLDISICGLSETKWSGAGHFTTLE